MKVRFLQGTANTKGNLKRKSPKVHNEDDIVWIISLNYFPCLLASFFCSSFVSIDKESTSGLWGLSKRTENRKGEREKGKSWETLVSIVHSGAKFCSRKFENTWKFEAAMDWMFVFPWFIWGSPNPQCDGILCWSLWEIIRSISWMRLVPL